MRRGACGHGDVGGNTWLGSVSVGCRTAVIACVSWAGGLFCLLGDGEGCKFCSILIFETGSLVLFLIVD